jgi:hypothetical protein
VSSALNPQGPAIVKAFLSFFKPSNLTQKLNDSGKYKLILEELDIFMENDSKTKKELIANRQLLFQKRNLILYLLV